MTSSLSFGMITPSYAPDFDRCKLLCRSIEQWVKPPYSHYIVVDDRQDYDLFKQLQSSTTIVLMKDDILPWWIQRLPGVRKFWFSWKTLPIRGWVFQQIVKIATAQYMSEDVAVFVDSDTTFVRPVDFQNYVRAGKVRFYDEPGGNFADMPNHVKWHNAASKLLGLPPTPMPAPDYIQNVVTWRRDHVKQLCDRIESVSGRGWIETLGGCLQLSEYILYGTFIDRVLGEDTGHYRDAQKICLDYWTPEAMSEAELRHFVSTIQPEHIAVMISAKAGMSVDRYSQLLNLISESRV